MSEETCPHRVHLALTRPADPFYPALTITADSFAYPESYGDFLGLIEEALRGIYETIADERGKSSDKVLGAIVEAEWARRAALD